MSEAVSIILTSCDRGCNPRILFGGACIVLMSTVQHFGLVTLPISVESKAYLGTHLPRATRQGCLAR